MGMTIDTIIKDCEQSIKQNELFIKAHQANMEIGEIKEYQYYIERDKLTIDTMRKYQQIQKIVKNTQQLCSYGSAFIDIREVVEYGITGKCIKSKIC